MKNKLIRDHTKQDFLLTFFDKENRYEEKEVNGYWLIRQFNSETGNWQVAIYTPESYKRRKEWQLGRRGN
jgi:hypothetical protein